MDGLHGYKKSITDSVPNIYWKFLKNHSACTEVWFVILHSKEYDLIFDSIRVISLLFIQVQYILRFGVEFVFGIKHNTILCKSMYDSCWYAIRWRSVSIVLSAAISVSYLKWKSCSGTPLIRMNPIKLQFLCWVTMQQVDNEHREFNQEKIAWCHSQFWGSSWSCVLPRLAKVALCVFQLLIWLAFPLQLTRESISWYCMNLINDILVKGQRVTHHRVTVLYLHIISK